MRNTYGLPKKREEVIEVLQQAFVQQNLEEDEYELRLTEAHHAVSLEELEAVIRDFPAEIRRRLFPPQHHSQQVNGRSEAMPFGHQVIHRVMLNSPTASLRINQLTSQPIIFSTILGKQQADFRLCSITDFDHTIKVECVLGETILDLRNESLQNTQLNISITGALGTVKIMLPRGAEIDPRISLIAGELKIRDKQRGWLRRVIGQQEPIPTEAINCRVTISGSFLLGQVMIIF